MKQKENRMVPVSTFAKLGRDGRSQTTLRVGARRLDARHLTQMYPMPSPGAMRRGAAVSGREGRIRGGPRICHEASR